MKAINPIAHILFFGLFTVAVSGCATGSRNVSDGIYTSPLNNFSVPVPRLPFYTQMTEEKDTHGGFISFHGDAGGLYAIGHLVLTPSDEEIYDDPNLRDRAYSSYLHDFIFQNILKQAPGTEVLHEEFLGEDEDREFFAVINIPEGSPLMEMRSGKRFDSTRALLFFKASGTLYMLQVELRAPVFITEEFTLNDLTLERARNRLHRFKETIDFR